MIHTSIIYFEAFVLFGNSQVEIIQGSGEKGLD